jgi:hypothetical protein
MKLDIYNIVRTIFYLLIHTVISEEQFFKFWHWDFFQEIWKFLV